MDAIVDTDLVLARKRRALRQKLPGADFLMRHATDELAARLAVVDRRFEVAAALNAFGPGVAETLMASGKVGRVVRLEADRLFLGGADGLVSHPEKLPFESGSLDLAVSVLSLQDINDIPGMLAQIRRALRPDGLFLGALAGAGTLTELRDSLLAAEIDLHGGASPRVMPFTDVRDAGALLQRAGFALPVADVETLTVRYGSILALMRDLRGMGATNSAVARARRPATRQLFVRASEIYASRYADPDGRLRASYSIVWMSGWAPHASQQKPLKPGSASMSMAEALRRTRQG